MIYLTVIVSVFILIIIASIFTHNNIIYSIIFGFILCIYPIIKFGTNFYSSKCNYTSNYKFKIINKIVKFVSNNLIYSPIGFVDWGKFEDSKIFKHSIDRYSSEDLVTGIIDKTEIVFSEVHAEYKTETRSKHGGKQTEWHTVFKGLFFVADFNKDFDSFTVVMPDKAERILGKFGQTLQSMSTVLSTRELVKMENDEFENFFAVFSPNQVEARYILSPSIMEKLVNFRKAVNRDVYISFNFSKVYIGVPFTENLFEPPLFNTIVDLAPIERYYKIIELMVGIVEELDLNTRIWSKE